MAQSLRSGAKEVAATFEKSAARVKQVLKDKRGFASFGSNRKFNKQVSDVAKELRMSKEQRKEFGDYVESLKEGVRGGSDHYSFKELNDLGKEFLELYGK